MAGLQNVVVVVGEQFSPFEFSIACEVFGVDRTEDGVPAFDFAVCSSTGGPLRSDQGFSLTADHGLERLAEADLVIVAPSKPDHGPGGAELDRALHAALARGATVASFCSAAFTLARSGLLDGVRATTHYRHAAELARRFPEVVVVPDVLYVEDTVVTAGVEATVATSAGTAAGIDLCLHLVRKHLGSAVATAIARRMVVPPHRDGGQAQFVEAPVRPCADESLGSALVWAAASLDREAPVRPCADESLGSALVWAAANLHREVDVATWARTAAMSPRTFARRFRAETGVTPHRWLLEQRVGAARLLLEDGDESVDEVARRCGFGSAAMLRQHFLKLVGTTPTAYRRTFRGARAPAAVRLLVPVGA